MSIPTLLFMSHDSFKLNTELMKSCFIICDGPLGCLVNIFQFSDVPYKDKQKKKKTKVTSTVRAVIKRQRLGISPGYYQCGPRLLSKENSRKIESKETPSCLIPHLLPVVFTRPTWNLRDSPDCIVLKLKLKAVIKIKNKLVFEEFSSWYQAVRG